MISRLLVAVLSACQGGACTAAVIVGSWTPIYTGIDHAVGTADINEPRPQWVNALRIDLHHPGVQLFGTPSNGAAPLETTSQNASQFLTQYGLQVAVNTSFYTPCCSSIPEGKDLIGLAISEGALVSPAQAEARAALLITWANVASLVNTVDEPWSTAGVRTAFAGSNFLLGNRSDLPTSPDNVFPARTLAGLGDDVPGDNRYLILIAIDTGLPGVSQGASRAESAAWLQRFGAHTGINLDGGGSTTMVRADGAGWKLLNRPNGGTFQRLNGSHVGAFASSFTSLIQPALATKWLVGVRDNAVSDFSAEDGTANSPPGDSAGLDDDYYLAGSYPAPVGALLTDEPWEFLERAVIRFDPPNDTTLRFHFSLTGDEAHGLNGFRYSTHVYQQDGDGDREVTLEILLNGIAVETVSLTQGQSHRTTEFSAAAVNAVAGPNVLTVRQTGGSARWTNFDFHQFEIRVVPPALRIVRVLPSQVDLAWTTNVTGYVLQSTSNLQALGSWSDIANSHGVIGNEFVVSLPSTGQAKFFRLSR